jgi:type VI secretion system protein ImpL
LRSGFIVLIRNKKLLAVIFVLAVFITGFFAFWSKTNTISQPQFQDDTNYQVLIKAMPTNVNAGAALTPHSTSIELYGKIETQQLISLNFPESKTFEWSPKVSGDLILRVKIGNIVLTRRYTGHLAFPKFLKEFSEGERIFMPTDFSEDYAPELRRMGVQFISVTYIIIGADTIKNKYFKLLEES